MKFGKVPTESNYLDNNYIGLRKFLELYLLNQEFIAYISTACWLNVHRAYRFYFGLSCENS